MEKKPFSIRLREADKQHATTVMEAIKRSPDEPQSESFMRIIEFAEANQFKASHPDLEPQLSACEDVIKTLIKTINGVVAAQDLKVSNLKDVIDQLILDCEDSKDRAEAIEEEAQLRLQELEEEAAACKKRAVEAEKRAETAERLADERGRSFDLFERQIESLTQQVESLKTQIEQQAQSYGAQLADKDRQCAELMDLLKHKIYEP